MDSKIFAGIGSSAIRSVLLYVFVGIGLRNGGNFCYLHLLVGLDCVFYLY